jgi:hypothetical protein
MGAAQEVASGSLKGMGGTGMPMRNRGNRGKTKEKKSYELSVLCQAVPGVGRTGIPAK